MRHKEITIIHNSLRTEKLKVLKGIQMLYRASTIEHLRIQNIF